MSNRELLDLAAKAIGKECKYSEVWKTMMDIHGAGWNPLEDDGDALRLAVKLKLEVDICITGIAVRTPVGHKVLVDAEMEPDGYAATRLAIVMAAAKIGEATHHE